MIARARKAGVSIIINAGYDIRSSEAVLDYTRRYEGVYAVLGIHPHDAKDAPPDALEKLEGLLKNPGVLGVGEVGLDYHYDLSPRDIQRELFVRQLELAIKLSLPVVIHDREAHGDVMEVLRGKADRPLTGVLHCFSGSLEMARECIKLGFYLSVGGPVTFANARRLHDIVKALPLDRLLLETDCPYLAPAPHRGKRNEPAFVRFIAQRIAELKGLPVEEVEAATTENARRIFGIDAHATPEAAP